MAQWPGLCECCNPPGGCGVWCCATSCPCVLVGQYHEKAGTDKCAMMGGVKMGIPIAFVAIGAVLSQLGGDIFYIIGMLIVIISEQTAMTFVLLGRQKLAAKYGIPCAFCPDCCIVEACFPCAIIQEYKMVEGGGNAGGAGPPAVVGQPVGAPA